MTKRKELTLLESPNVRQLHEIKTNLDLVLLALVTIAEIDSEVLMQAAKELDLDLVIGCENEKKLDVEAARSLVLIICHLAQQHQELIRRAVSLLEQITEQNKEPEQTNLLGKYLEQFINTYQERIKTAENIAPETLSSLALKLLVNLLFYSSNNGHRFLWSAMLERAS